MMALSRRLMLTLTLLLCSLTSLAYAQAVPTIRVGWTLPGEEAKYWMMKRPEAFPNLGKRYRIEWTQFQGTSPMVQAMISEALDCSSQAPLSLAQGAINARLEAYALMQHIGESPQSFSVYWAVTADSPIRRIEDLKGKVLGVNVYGSGVYGGMAMLLKRHGLDAAKDIKLVETGFPGSESALRAGRVDAAVFVQPFALRAEQKGGLRKLFSLQDLMPNTVHVVEVCSKSAVDRAPEAIRHYVQDLNAALKMAIAQRDDTLKVVSDVTRAPVAALEPYLMKTNDFARSADGRVDFAAMQAMVDQYVEIGLLSKPLKVEQFRQDGLTTAATTGR